MTSIEYNHHAPLWDKAHTSVGGDRSAEGTGLQSPLATGGTTASASGFHGGKGQFSWVGQESFPPPLARTLWHPGSRPGPRGARGMRASPGRMERGDGPWIPGA